MGQSKRKGDIGETQIMADALKRGYKVAIPFGEDWPYDLIVLRHNNLERVQCKYTESNGDVIKASCRSINNTVKQKYTKNEIDWLAVYDITTDCCYYIPASELGSGMAQINLRLTPTKHNQVEKIRCANDYLAW